jgi:tetratricopeptide (TPR) repeat protein
MTQFANRTSRHVLACYRQGMSAFNAGNYRASVDLLEGILDSNSMESLMARFYAGQARYRLGLSDLKASRYESAANHFQRALDHNPQAGGLARYLATCHVGMRDYDKAAEAFAAVVRADPQADDARIRGALALWKAGRSPEAIDLLREGIATSVAEPELHYQLGLMLAACDRYDEAIAQLNTAEALRPDHPETLVRLAWCYAAMDNVPKAFDLIQDAYALRPYDPEIAMQLAIAARAVQVTRPDVTVELPARQDWSPQETDAMDHLAQLIAEAPDFIEAMLALEHTDVDPQIFRLLAGTLEAALRKNPEYADLHYHVSRVYERLGDPEKAIEASHRALSINPRYTQALIHLARVYASTNRQVDAIERLEAAVARGADYPDVHCMLGNLYRDTGRKDRAQRAYRRAIWLNQDYLDAMYALANLGS